MPFCTNCGNAVGPKDVFCAKCGGRQPQPPPPISDFMTGMSPRTASLLCYIPVLGWIGAIIVLASTRFRNDPRVRFNAFQGLYLFVAWLLVDWVVSPFFWLPFPGTHLHHMVPDLLKLGIFCSWIFMIVKASQDQLYKLPIIGDLAEKSLSEQRRV